MNYPKKVTIGDITVRDGFQHEEKFIPTEAKVWLAEQLIISRIPVYRSHKFRKSAGHA